MNYPDHRTALVDEAKSLYSEYLGAPDSMESDVIGILENPDSIRKSKTDENVHLFHRERKYCYKNYHMCVAINGIEGFIITTYITYKIKHRVMDVK